MADRESTPARFSELMQRSVALLTRAERSCRPADVHRARVALRRCRAIASTVHALDPDPRWARVRALSRRVFRSLGRLRDLQVVQAWVEQLSEPGDVARARLRRQFRRREMVLTLEVRHALGAFDARAWHQVGDELDPRIQRVMPDGPAARAVVRARVDAVSAAHAAALRHPSVERWHALRVAVKRLRYCVELLSPSFHARWSADLRKVQSLLGDVHDTDVLESLAREDARRDSHRRALTLLPAIRGTRAARLRAVRTHIRGGHLLRDWRQGLPTRAQAATGQLEALASATAPSALHAEGVLASCEALLDAFGPQLSERRSSAEALLRAAALLQWIGVPTQATPKATARMIRHIEPPPGWSRSRVRVVSLIVREALRRRPSRSGTRHKPTPPRQQALVGQLGALLRLSCALGAHGLAPSPRVAAGQPLRVVVLSTSRAGDRDRTAVKKAVRRIGAAFDVRVRLVDPTPTLASSRPDGSA